jgi:hypothetical protein
MLSINPSWKPFITAIITVKAKTPVAMPRIAKRGDGAADLWEFPRPRRT